MVPYIANRLASASSTMPGYESACTICRVLFLAHLRIRILTPNRRDAGILHFIVAVGELWLRVMPYISVAVAFPLHPVSTMVRHDCQP